MNDGALVLADCLGFKGIWSKVQPEVLSRRLHDLHSRAEQVVAETSARNPVSFGPIQFHIRFLSDTVALSVHYEQASSAVPNRSQSDLLVSVACQVAGVLFGMFMDEEPVLPLRGCIAYGPHLCDGNFLIGPAVDEAAEYMNVAEGAFIWLLPAAAERAERFFFRSVALMKLLPDEILRAGIGELVKRGLLPGSHDPEKADEHYLQAFRMTSAQFATAPVVIFDYPMPLKGGSSLRVPVVNPLFAGKTPEIRRSRLARFDQYLNGNRLDVWLKRQHTMTFLETAQKATETFTRLLGSGDYPQVFKELPDIDLSGKDYPEE
jgi:hypothetical protein